MKLKRMSAALAASIAALGLFASSAYAVYDTSVKNDATTASPEKIVTAASQAAQNAPAPLTDQQQAQKQIGSADQGITKVQQVPTAAWVVAPAYMQSLTARGSGEAMLKYVSADLGYADGATTDMRQAVNVSAQPATKSAYQLT
jgi:uncharacterized membrane-anchored protein